MARNQEVVSCPPGEWTQLTNGDVSAITFQCIGPDAWVRYTTDATAPTTDMGFLSRTGDGPINRDMSDLTNLSGADRVWAKPKGTSYAFFIVDHA
jgi:hypothetical protein